MRRAVLALSVYVSIGAFCSVNALALLSGVPVFTAVQKGLVAMALLVGIGVVASMVAVPGRSNGRQKDAES